ncbi:MAG: CoF synthetase [Streptococcaceae bacterium]|jgi:putative adenylate-forming enzyme|nr:CoF synthetase [Streptococcaceae bacterium]
MIEKLRILIAFINARYFVRFDKIKQEKLYAKQASFLCKNSAFYSSGEFPLMNKKLLMENFDSINTVGLTKETALSFAIDCERTREFNKKLHGVTVGLSSGTSGHRGVFLVSDAERALWAGTILAKTLPRGKLFGHKIAFFMRANSELYETVSSRFIQFEFFDLEVDMSAHLKGLEDFQPTILVAPPSALLKIAKESHLRPMKVISIAEVLEARDAVKISDGLGVSVVHQIYQCTEGFLAATCEYGTLHLNEEVCHIEKEWLDERRFIPIVSDLKRRAEPIMNYRLNDILMVKSESCPCGNKALALEKIEGRQDDMFIFNGLNGGNVEIFPDFIRRCLLFSDEIEDYRVVQNSRRELDVLADNLSETTCAQVQMEINKLARDRAFIAPNINFKVYEHTNNKKLRRIESHVER